MSCTIYLHPDNTLTFSATITNEGVPVNDATVTATLTDMSDVDVTGQSWPITLSYVTDSDGIYSASVTPVSGIVAGTKYKVILDVEGDGGEPIAQWLQYATATIRGCDA